MHSVKRCSNFTSVMLTACILETHWVDYGMHKGSSFSGIQHKCCSSASTELVSPKEKLHISQPRAEGKGPVNQWTCACIKVRWQLANCTIWKDIWVWVRWDWWYLLNGAKPGQNWFPWLWIDIFELIWNVIGWGGERERVWGYIKIWFN